MNKLVIKKILLVMLELVYAILTIFLALLTKNLLDSLSNKDIFIFTKISLISIVVISAIIICQTIIIKLKNNIIYNKMKSLRIDAMQSIMSKNCRSLSKEESSEYFSLFTNSLEIYEKSFLRVKQKLVGSFIMFFASFLTIISFNILFLPLIIISLISIVIIPMLVSKKIQDLSDDNIKNFENLINKTREYLDTFYITKVYKVTDEIVKKYSIVTNVSMESKRKFQDKLGLSNAIIAFLNICISMSIYILGGFLVINEKMTIGSLIAVGQLMTNLFSPLMEIVFAYNEINSTKGIRESVNRILLGKEECRSNNSKDENDFSTLKVLVESLKYNNNVILKNVNLKFEKGKKYVIIGKNGSGKSSIARVISGINSKFKGDILIDDRSINFTELQSRKILYCSKHNQLYNESVEENLRIVENVFLDNINSTLVKNIKKNQDVCSLSEGEKQKLILYRTINADYDIKIYDEPESALDDEAKSNIFSEIFKDKDACNIIITHKMDESLSDFDKIIYIFNKECFVFNTYNEFIAWEGF